jgi:hypothetical protein
MGTSNQIGENALWQTLKIATSRDGVIEMEPDWSRKHRNCKIDG